MYENDGFARFAAIPCANFGSISLLKDTMVTMTSTVANTMVPAFRRPCVTDLPAIMQIQRECYPPTLREDRLTFEERLAAAAEHCWVAQDDHRILAYLFAYTSVFGKVTPFDGGFAVDSAVDTLYLHDLAVSKRAAGRGLGSSLVDIALANAESKGLVHSALVAVQGSRPFWERHGYRPRDTLASAEAENLCTYPGSALYMARLIQSGQAAS